MYIYIYIYVYLCNIQNNLFILFLQHRNLAWVDFELTCGDSQESYLALLPPLLSTDLRFLLLTPLVAIPQ